MSDKQLALLFRHLAKGDSISTLEAMSLYGICRLSERIRELERRGWIIRRERVKGEKKYVRYWLVRDAAGLGDLAGLPVPLSATSAESQNSSWALPNGAIPYGST